MPGDASRQNGKAGGRPRNAKSPATIRQERARAKVLDELEITAERTMREIARVAFADRTGIYDPAGRIKPIDQWTPEQAACLDGLEVIIKNAQAGDGHVDTVHKIKLSPKADSLKLLAQHFGLLTNKLEVSGKLTLEDLIVQSRTISSQNS